MSIFFLKSLLSVVLLLSAVIAMYTMFEVFGRKDIKINSDKLKRLHRLNGIFYLLVFAFIAYFCINFIVVTRAELSTRSTFHSLFAVLVIVLMGIKISYIRVYRHFYNQAKMFGLIMAILTFGIVATSGGYYLLVSDFGTDPSFDKLMQYKTKVTVRKEQTIDESVRFSLKTDSESVGRGKTLFGSKCSFCHNAYSTDNIVGPGLKGILKNDKLPVSKRPASPVNILLQFTEPFNRMPSFDHLSEEEMSDILAFLNTL